MPPQNTSHTAPPKPSENGGLTGGTSVLRVRQAQLTPSPFCKTMFDKALNESDPLALEGAHLT